jgi:hypothetical protein
VVLHSQRSQRLIDQTLRKSARGCRLTQRVVYVTVIPNQSTKLGRNALRGPDFVWNDFYLTKWFFLTEHVKL